MYNTSEDMIYNKKKYLIQKKCFLTLFYNM